jgi:hypothetical protein
MNCKPGDLAAIVREMLPGTPCGLIGRHVTLTSLDLNDAYEPSWNYDGPTLLTPYGFPAEVIPDRCLRPIRDPGDDAVDESRAWLPPVPLPLLEKA